MNLSPSLLYLSGDTLKKLNISTAEVVASIEHLIRGVAKDQVWNTPKSVIQPGDGRYMMSTLSAADDPPYLAVKSVIMNPRNTERGLPQINGLIMLLDSDTGVPVAIVDGNWVTALRTAGASALAALRLAKKDSAVIAFIGCGVQAHSHLQAFAELFPIKEVHAFGRGSTNRDALCTAASDMGLKAIASDSAKQAIENADIVISSVTLSHQIDAFLDAHWLKPGAFVSSTDLAIPWIKPSMSAFDKIIIDDLVQESNMPDPLVDAKLVSGDLHGLINGDESGCSIGRTNDQQRTAFVFRAVALGDLALAGLAYQKAVKNGEGFLIEG